MNIREVSINSCTHGLFNDIWDMYNQAFPYEEKRSLPDQREIMKNSHYSIKAWQENNVVLGFISFWEYDRFFYVEHYAINPDVRSKGYGKRFLQSFMELSEKQIILEIEPVTDVKTQRRLNFYRHLSFRENPIKHAQLPYHEGLEPLPLKILSFPGTVSYECYHCFQEKLKNEIMPRLVN